ncbi:phospholipase D-like domain-containing protein [Mesorhizobium sp. J428]|uniref:phospholipase D-like domain-containing protein n=1 Tax=Mesorhizobium sp. J428 TaxID=2898440 RepID=UPI002150E38B|nr:phospholipase D-like domain-containing protein [Mesorhizobium sp. J428]MCR5860034.1 phospholipase D-like domain-containing protein [Mesorhizobium sp. J428]
MQARGGKNGISVNVIAGTYVVFFGLDATPPARQNLLGFAFRRVDHTEVGTPGSDRWLLGSKVFRAIEPAPDLGKGYASNTHPVQSFVWSDYAAKENHHYTYLIHPMYGPHDQRRLGDPVEVTVRTEEDDAGDHAVFFNRGAVASQAYMQKFKTSIRPPEPDNPDHPQTAWLSRGLFEALRRFVLDASSGDQLRVAAYEFHYLPVIRLLRDAQKRGVDVRIIYEGGTEIKYPKKGSGGVRKIVDTQATADNKKALAGPDADFDQGTLIARTKRLKIPHNKFIVKLRGGVPTEVWTGSANFSMSGFLGQANTGHLIRDKRVAGEFLDYWTKLEGDTEPDDLKAWMATHSPDPGDDLPVGTTTLFSPRKGARMLKWYGARAAEADKPWLFTAAFGLNAKTNAMHTRLVEPRDHLRFILMEKDEDNILPALHEQDPNISVAVGSVLGRDGKQREIPGWDLQNWHREIHFRGTRGHVFYVHQKFLVVDPLGDDPLVFAGSANFSEGSLTGNDENMLLIRGDKRVAHIYFTEFDRLFRHFLYRKAANANAGGGAAADDSRFLAVDDSWVDKHFRNGSYQDKRREMFK